MAPEHRGNAELLNGRGEIVDRVVVSLQARPATGCHTGLLGRAYRTTERGLGFDWHSVVAIRLADGVEAPIIITKERIRSAESDTIRTANIRGRGSPPF